MTQQADRFNTDPTVDFRNLIDRNPLISPIITEEVTDAIRCTKKQSDWADTNKKPEMINLPPIKIAVSQTFSMPL